MAPEREAQIHPTAIVSPGAEVAPGVRVGAYAIIEEGTEIGEGCEIGAHARIGTGTRLGCNNTIGYGAFLGGAPQDLSFDPAIRSAVVIGSGNNIREYCTIHRASSEGGATVLGDGNFLMVGTHVAHDVRIGDRCVFANNVLLAGHVRVGDRVFIGGGSVFHQYIRIGEMAVTQGLSAFSKDVPPFVMAAERNLVVGLNVVGLRRNGLTLAQRSRIKDAFRLLYRSGLNVSQALARAEEVEWDEYAARFFDFVRSAGKRGICEAAEGKVMHNEG